MKEKKGEEDKMKYNGKNEKKEMNRYATHATRYYEKPYLLPHCLQRAAAVPYALAAHAYTHLTFYLVFR